MADWVIGAQLFESRDYRNAIWFYERGLKKHEKHPAFRFARLDLAYSYFRMGDLTRAMEELEILVSGEKPPHDAFLLLARLLLIVGRPSSAMSTLREGLAWYPGDGMLVAALGRLLVSREGDEQAIEEAYDRADILLGSDQIGDGERGELELARAHYELAMGDAAKGERLLARLLAGGKAPVDSYLLKGEVLLAKGRIFQAREQLRRSIQVDPLNPRPLILLSRSYLCDEACLDAEKAGELAELACKLSSWQNAEALAALVEAYEANDNSALALLLCEKIMTLPSRGELRKPEAELIEQKLQVLRTSFDEAA